MKKIAGKIAMILILVMLANSFSGCIALGIMAFGGNLITDYSWGLFGLDLLVTAIVVIVSLAVGEAPNETGIHLASAKQNFLAEYYSAMELFNSLPETERLALMEKIKSMPETEFADLVSTVASLPEAEIIASIERLNALSEAELASVVQDFNALSETEFDLLTDKLNERVHSLPETDYVAVLAVSP